MTEHAPGTSFEPVGPLNAILLPTRSKQVKEWKIAQWLKQEGEGITAGEPLVVVETSEETFTITAAQTGRLWRISKTEGSVVPVGTLLGLELPDEPPQAPAAGRDRALIVFFMVALGVGGVLLVLQYLHVI